MTYNLRPLGKKQLTEEEFLAEIDKMPDKVIEENNNDNQGLPGELQEGIDQELPTVILEDDFLKLENIVCYAADNSVIEEYDELYLGKDVVRNKDGSHQKFTPYQAITYFEKQKNSLFLPSSALQCVILASLFKSAVKKNRKGKYEIINKELESVLQQYKDYGPGYGWHNLNTVIDYGRETIIHYPSDGDFPTDGGTDNINQGKRKDFSFSKSDLVEGLLSEKLKVPAVNQFVRNFSGLKDPSVLVPLGNYFDRPGYVWFRYVSSTATMSGWLGCVNYYFNLFANNFLDNFNAARSVALPEYFQK